MIGMNIKFFRRRCGMTQEQLAEALAVSRQTVAKWEAGEVAPNIADCQKMQEIFDISLDDLVREMDEAERERVVPRGKHLFGLVTVGERGQIVIPKEARKVFGISAGDKLVVLGDEAQGIALVKAEIMNDFVLQMLRATEKAEREGEDGTGGEK